MKAAPAAEKTAKPPDDYRELRCQGGVGTLCNRLILKWKPLRSGGIEIFYKCPKCQQLHRLILRD